MYLWHSDKQFLILGFRTSTSQRMSIEAVSHDTRTRIRYPGYVRLQTLLLYRWYIISTIISFLNPHKHSNLSTEIYNCKQLGFKLNHPTWPKKHVTQHVSKYSIVNVKLKYIFKQNLNIIQLSIYFMSLKIKLTQMPTSFGPFSDFCSKGEALLLSTCIRRSDSIVAASGMVTLLFSSSQSLMCSAPVLSTTQLYVCEHIPWLVPAHAMPWQACERGNQSILFLSHSHIPLLSCTSYHTEGVYECPEWHHSYPGCYITVIMFVSAQNTVYILNVFCP